MEQVLRTRYNTLVVWGSMVGQLGKGYELQIIAHPKGLHPGRTMYFPKG